MEFTEVVHRRHMVRRFSGEPVSPDSLERILHNAARGPSAGFSQGQAFLVLTGDDLADFWRVTGEAVSETAQTAPLIIVAMSCKRVYLDRQRRRDREARPARPAAARRPGALRPLVGLLAPLSRAA